jgi:hypothetical protein
MASEDGVEVTMEELAGKAAFPLVQWAAANGSTLSCIVANRHVVGIDAKNVYTGDAKNVWVVTVQKVEKNSQ